MDSVQPTAIVRRWLAVTTVSAVLLGSWGSGALASEDAEKEFFSGFISPVSNPVNFEDPRSRSEVRTLYVYHKLSNEFGDELDPAGIGGDAHIVAVQIRLALTDRLSFIATKDGYIWLRPERVLTNEDGWANLAAGFKYTFFRDLELGALATVGLRYEFPTGNTDVFQGQHPALGTSKSRGDGVFNPFLSIGWGKEDLGPGDLHALTYLAGRIPGDGYDSTFFDWSLHLDYGYDLGDFGTIFPLFELNLIQTVDGGRRLPISQEGFDFFNFGSANAAHHTVMTAAYGFRYRLFDGVGDLMGHALGADLGATYEHPITDREDLFGWRVTTDITFFLD